MRIKTGPTLRIFFNAEEKEESKIKTVIRSNWKQAGTEAVPRSLGYCCIIAESHRQSSHVQHILDSFVLPPTCAARNLQPGKIYGAPTNRVNPVLSPEAFFVKIITSIYSPVGPILLAPTFCVYLNNQHTLKAPGWNERRHQFYWAQ